MEVDGERRARWLLASGADAMRDASEGAYSDYVKAGAEGLDSEDLEVIEKDLHRCVRASQSSLNDVGVGALVLST